MLSKIIPERKHDVLLRIFSRKAPFLANSNLNKLPTNDFLAALHACFRLVLLPEKK